MPAVAALLGLTVSTFAASEEPTPVRIGGECVGPTESDNAALATTQLSTYGIDAAVSMPTEVVLGAPATVSVSLSFELTDYLVQGAAALGIESVDFAGSEFPVTLVSPSGSEQKVIIPPEPVVDTSTPQRVELGSAQFTLPTDTPGAFRVRVEPSTLVLQTSPDDLSATATCTDDGYSALPVGFIIDPLAPTIEPRIDEVTIGDERRNEGTLDLRDRVTAGAGPILEDSWRVVSVDTVDEATVTLENGILTYDVTGAPAIVTWEVCGLSAEPTPTGTGSSSTTSSTPTNSVPGTEQALAATAVEQVENGSDEPPAAPTSHCAQGVLRLQGQVTDVLSGSAGSVSESPQSLESPQSPGSPTPASGTGTPGAAGVPVSVTG